LPAGAKGLNIFFEPITSTKVCYIVVYFLFLGIAHAMALGLGPWLAVEIPELIEKGVITYKEKVPDTVQSDPLNL
jgi:hypothetical protein